MESLRRILKSVFDDKIKQRDKYEALVSTYTAKDDEGNIDPDVDYLYMSTILVKDRDTDKIVDEAYIKLLKSNKYEVWANIQESKDEIISHMRGKDVK